MVIVFDLDMFEMLPFANQPYNDNVFNIVAYKLVDQAPCVVSWVLDSIVSKLSSRTTPAFLKDLLPTYQNTLEKSEITMRYPYEKKVSYFWIFKKLIQLLLWKESKPAIHLGNLLDLYKVCFMEISENALKIQQIISEYVSRSISKPTLLGFDNSRPVESSALPSNQNVIDDQDLVGTSDSHLTPDTQKDENFSETEEHAHKHSSNDSFPEFKLQYCFGGSSKIQARDFISDYDFLALRNKWSPEEKMEFFPNHLENDALNWYLSIQDHLTSWKMVKMEFMQKYLAD